MTTNGVAIFTWPHAVIHAMKCNRTLVKLVRRDILVARSGRFSNCSGNTSIPNPNCKYYCPSKNSASSDIRSDKSTQLVTSKDITVGNLCVCMHVPAQVVRLAKEMATMLANAINADQCIKVLFLIIQLADYPINLAAIKMPRESYAAAA